MPTQNVNLPEHQSLFIREMMAGGRYQNASEVVRAGLRLLEGFEEEQRLKLERLRQEVQKGVDDLDAGRTVTLNTKAERADFFADVRKRGEKRRAKKKHV